MHFLTKALSFWSRLLSQSFCATEKDCFKHSELGLEVDLRRPAVRGRPRSREVEGVGGSGADAGAEEGEKERERERDVRVAKEPTSAGA